VGSCSFVLLYSHPRREHPSAHEAGVFILPGPHPHKVAIIERPLKLLRLGGGVELDVFEGWRPLGSPRDEGGVTLDPDWNLASRRAQDRWCRSFLLEQPSRANQGVTGERELRPRREVAAMVQ